jgi:hypothetical protein
VFCPCLGLARNAAEDGIRYTLTQSRRPGSSFPATTSCSTEGHERIPARQLSQQTSSFDSLSSRKRKARLRRLKPCSTATLTYNFRKLRPVRLVVGEGTAEAAER